MTINRQILLASRPHGEPRPENFRLAEVPRPQPDDGQFLVEVDYLSVDPYMRGRMNDVKSYIPPFQVGEVLGGEGVGRVTESKHPNFPTGSHVAGMFGWQQFALSDGSGGVRILDPELAPVTTALHVLGMPGMTAYFGVTDVCQAKSGETLFVTGGAGAVGTVVGQLGKLFGCRVVGSAGSDDKVDYLTSELGYDAAFNYKSTGDYVGKLKELCPQGIDAFFDNTGGPVSDAVFPLLTTHARVAICGQISMYNATEVPQGPRLFGHLIVKRATVQGFLVMDYAPRFRAAMEQMATWYGEGKLKMEERIVSGIENAPTAFMEMLRGANTGKQLVQVS